jgi:hypothetical protein
VADAVGREPVSFPALQGDLAKCREMRPDCLLISVCLQQLKTVLLHPSCREKHEGLQGRAG